MQRLTLEQLINVVGGTPVGISDISQSVEQVCIDSRILQRGQVFWALRGTRYDGHGFLAESMQRGAVACIVDSLDRSSIPQIRVHNTQTALEDFAGWYRSRQSADVIAITGSVGKTTTRRMIFEVLRQQFFCVQSPKNFNNHIGVPLSVLKMTPEHDFAVFELGASGTGEIRDLGRLVAPDLGVITTIAPAHLEGFGDVDSIAREKATLIDCLPSSGLAVLNGDDDRVRSVADAAHCCVVFVGETDHNHIQATSVTSDIHQLRFEIDGQEFTVPATGRHHLTSALSAIAIGRELGMHDDRIADGLLAFQPASGRCQVEHIGPWTVINDTYNSNPRSLRAACDVLKQFGQSRCIMVAADMLELGSHAEQLHRTCGAMIADSGVDLLVAVGDFAAHLAAGVRDAERTTTQVIGCARRDDVPEILESELQSGDVILVKGSRAMQMETIVEWLRQQARKRLAA